MVNYPFHPRSTRQLVAGHFWGIPLDDGRFACGRVLQVGGKLIPTPRVSFFAGLLKWIGLVPPTFDSIAGAGLLAYICVQ